MSQPAESCWRHESAHSGAPSRRQVQLMGQVVYPGLPLLCAIGVGGRENLTKRASSSNDSVRSGYRIERKEHRVGGARSGPSA